MVKFVTANMTVKASRRSRESPNWLLGTEVPDFAFAKNRIPCVLGLVDAVALPDEVTFVAAPLKLKGADGSPVRAFAYER